MEPTRLLKSKQIRLAYEIKGKIKVMRECGDRNAKVSVKFVSSGARQEESNKSIYGRLSFLSLGEIVFPLLFSRLVYGRAVILAVVTDALAVVTDARFIFIVFGDEFAFQQFLEDEFRFRVAL